MRGRRKTRRGKEPSRPSLDPSGLCRCEPPPFCHPFLFGFGKATAKLASLFGELAEVQKHIDDSARKIVEGIVRMIDTESDESPSSREALTGRDLSWYQDVTVALTSHGFSAPAAYEPTDWMSRPVESRALVEYALGDGGTIVACWFAIPATETRAESRLVNLFTAFEDGSTHDTVPALTDLVATDYGMDL